MELVIKKHRKKNWQNDNFSITGSRPYVSLRGNSHSAIVAALSEIIPLSEAMVNN
ncbi:hypothetical protein LLB_0616 [Legionella longbeachae D-4968]|nr:hypothetical protein LLB_0616 [Legionella longbeachae D-4968]